LRIDDPQPDKPLDVDKAAGEARKVWQVTSSEPLRGDTLYELQLTEGLETPLGPLPGEDNEILETVHTYGDFAFNGIECRLTTGKGKWFTIPEGGGVSEAECRPEDVSLLFSA